MRTKWILFITLKTLEVFLVMFVLVLPYLVGVIFWSPLTSNDANLFMLGLLSIIVICLSLAGCVVCIGVSYGIIVTVITFYQDWIDWNWKILK
jgi:hypothetical protein